MYISAYLLLIGAFLCAIFFAGLGATQLSMGRNGVLPYTEKAHIFLVVMLTMALFFLVNALVGFDFSLEYVFLHSNTSMGLRYRLAALWAGQAGSILLWTWMLSLCGLIFRYLPVYRRLTGMEKLWFWLFFYAIMALFLLLLTSWDNPFLLRSEAPPEGTGLSPVMRHPAMIFYRPLLLLGYSVLTIPACLTLSCILRARQNLEIDADSRRLKHRSIWMLARPAMLLGWFFLTMGLLCRAWRAHWEMRFGGYWTWDPAECSSFLPWLTATACLHAGQAWHRYRVLPRYTSFLAILTLSACLFSAWLARINVISSVHDLAAKSNGIPFLATLIFTCALGLYACITSEIKGKKIKSLLSPQGRLFLLSSVFLIFAGCVALATIWPLFSRVLVNLGKILPSAENLFPNGAVAPTSRFFNSISLPFTALCGVMLLECYARLLPSWSNTTKYNKVLCSALFGIFFIFACGSIFSSSLYALAWVCTAVFAASGVWALAVAVIPHLRKKNETGSLAVGMVHFGLALLVVSVFVSGLEKSAYEIRLSKGGSVEAGGFKISLVSLTRAKRYDHIKRTALLLIEVDGKQVGRLEPEVRRYFMHKDIHSSMPDSFFWKWREVRAGITEVGDEHTLRISFSATPLMNTIWIGGLVMAVFGLACLARKAAGNRPVKFNVHGARSDSGHA